MRSAELMRRLGVFIHPDFLSETICEGLTRGLAEAQGDAAEVYVGDERRVDPDIRRTRKVDIAAARRAEVQARLDAIRPVLASHFRVSLTGSEGVAFLVYEAGGFYRPHRDRVAQRPTSGGNKTHKRRISVVVFVNRAADAPSAFEYTGGRLTLYGLIDDPAWRDIGFPIDAEPGLLVAFDSGTLHEVTPVTTGLRMTAVDWFY